MESSAVEILLVDDNASDVELTLHALRHNCVLNRIYIAREGAEALDFLFRRGVYAERSAGSQPTIILLDSKLPEADGLNVLREVRANERTKGTPVVMLTSSREEAEAVKGYGLDVNGYIQKPVDITQFRAAISRLGLYWLVVNEPPPVAPSNL